MKSYCIIRLYLIIGTGLVLAQGCTKDDVEYQEDITFGTVKDIDGNVYKTIKIDFSSEGSKGLKSTNAETQTWMVENLKTTRYNNGDTIETTTPATMDLSKDQEIYYNYQWAYAGNESNVGTYGRLYTWMTVMDSRSICPEGWHVPTKAEWSKLFEYLGGKFVESFNEGQGSWDGIGGKLKESGTTHWESPNTGATNSIGFTALPGGHRYYEGAKFLSISNEGFWWSSTEMLNVWYRRAWIYTVRSHTPHVNTWFLHVNNGLSVRCMQN